MRLVCVSDTHGMLDQVKVPDGDVLLHAGDLTRSGKLAQVEAAASSLRALPHRHKVIIAGNHDFAFERTPLEARAAMHGLTYLQDEVVEVAGLRVWGAPWQPWFFNWAFNLTRGAALREKWRLIPAGVDVVLTHGPPLGILDTLASGEHVGCQDLREELLERVKPKLHVFGHIHEAHGVVDVEGVRFINAATCTLQYRPENAPVVVDV